MTIDQQGLGTATLRLEEPGRIEGRVAGVPYPGMWWGTLYRLSETGERIFAASIGGNQTLRIPVPQPGRYLVEVTRSFGQDGRSLPIYGAAEALVVQGAVEDIGTLTVARPGLFQGRPGSGVTAAQRSLLAGSAVTLRATYENGGTTSAENAVLRLESRPPCSRSSLTAPCAPGTSPGSARPTRS